MRRENWPELLAAFLEGRRDRPFLWASQDCATFVCDAILEMTGLDLAKDFRGRYESPETAADVMAAAGFDGLEDLAAKIAAANGLGEIPRSMAQRGDVVMFCTDEWGETLGIVDMDARFIVSPGPKGLVRVPTACAFRAWRV